MNTHKNTKYYFIVLIILVSCAVIEQPSGGPKDTTPPEINTTSVENLSTNFNQDEIQIEFTKYMNNNKVTDNLTISPEVKTNYSWRGKKLTIEFENELKENTTYSLQLGTDYTDWKNNKPAESYGIVFSTGNIIDTGIVEGEVIADRKLLEGSFVFLYRIDDIFADSLNAAQTIPDYRIQIGSNGRFTFMALKDGLYRLFAVGDRFKDGIIDLGMDNFSAAIDDVQVINGKAPNIKILLGPPADNIGPLLQSVTSIDSRTHEARFSENIMISSVKIDDLELINNDKSIGEEVTAFYQFSNLTSRILFLTENPLDSGVKYLFRINNVTDSLRNIIPDSSNTAEFYSTDFIEDLQPEILNFPFEDSIEFKIPPTDIYMELNTPIKNEEFSDIFTLLNLSDSSKINLNIENQPDNIIRFSDFDKLPPNKWFELKFNPKQLTTYFNASFRDTVYKLQFKNYDERSVAEVSGSIEPRNLCENIVLEFTQENITYRTKPNENGEWSLSNVSKGKYLVKVICDANNNGKYDYGFPYPFEYAENFYILKKDILVREGWDIEELILKID